MHCVTSVQIPSFFWSVFSVFGLNTGKYGPEKKTVFGQFSRSDELSHNTNKLLKFNLLL